MKDIQKIRNSILAAASPLFEKYGYEKTSMDEIASSAHKAKASIYYHFDSKLDIFRAVLKHEMDSVIGKLTEITVANTEPREQLIAYLKSRMEVILQARVFMHYIMAPYIERSGDVKEAVGEARKILDDWEYRYFADSCNNGIQTGILSDAVKPDAFARTMLAILKGLEIQYTSYEDREAMRSTYDAMVDILVTNNFTNATNRQAI